MSKLHKAVKKGDFLTVRLLIEKEDFNIDLLDCDGATALHNAAFYGRKEIVEYLCNKKANVNLGNYIGYTPLMASTREGYLEVVQILLQNGSSVNQVNDEGFTALVFSSGYSKNTEVLLELIKSGADVNHITNTGGSSLLWATWFGMVDNVRLLIEYGANKKLVFNGKLLIDIAHEKGFQNIEELLL